MQKRLGVDLRVLQIGHQFRGIGEHTKQLISHFPSSPLFSETEFVFYAYSDLDDPTTLIKSSLKQYPRFKVEKVGPAPPPLASTVSNYVRRIRYDQTYEYENRLASADVDAMLFIDFNLGVPATARYHKTLIMYDLIPFLFPNQYHPTYKQGRRQGAGVRAAGTDAYRNRLYSQALSRATAHADQILAISHHTKSDLVRELGLDASKIIAIALGVEPAPVQTVRGVDIAARTASNAETTLRPTDESFVFYMGGSDFRRRVSHLFEAFEQAKKTNADLKLVLAGADFTHRTAVPERSFRQALASSDYADDIFFLGYISDAERALLYQQALAFVYPTLYEGFGLPILEAMAFGCPVITYANSSTTEVGGDAALFATDVGHIADLIERLARDAQLVKQLRVKGLEQIRAFTWEETADKTLSAIVRPPSLSSLIPTPS